MQYIRVDSQQLAKQAEKYIFDAIKPGGFEEAPVTIPTLKDMLAWKTWANLMRPEQPTFVALDNKEIIGIVSGEPTETWFDEGESEIQELILTPNKGTEDDARELMKLIVVFYEDNNAKQAHVWCIKETIEKKNLNLKCKLAIGLGFKDLGFSRISKWTGKEIVKLEKVF